MNLLATKNLFSKDICIDSDNLVLTVMTCIDIDEPESLR